MYGIYRRISGFLLPNMWATSNSRWFLGANVGTHPKWTNGLNTQNSGTHDWISFGRFSDTSKPISNNLGTLRPKLWHTPIIHEENPTHPKTSKKNLETIINHQHPSAILHLSLLRASSCRLGGSTTFGGPRGRDSNTGVEAPSALGAKARGILVELDILRGWAVG